MDTHIALQQRARVEEFQRTHRIGLLTLLFTDMVGSTRLKQELGDPAAVALIRQHHDLVRDILKPFTEAQEISTAGDSFFLVFAKPSDAVKFSLSLQAGLRTLVKTLGRAISDRIGLHIGEVMIEERPDLPKTRDLYGLQVDICARVMSLAEGDQILMTRSAFDNARQILKGQEIQGLNRLNGLQWLNHGPYLLKGVEEPMEICEVGEVGQAVLKPPPDSEKVHRYVSPDSEPVLGWRPALGQKVAQTPWVLEEKLGEGGFGEVWLAQHEAMAERRVFKFCFRADRVRSLKREATLARLMKERLGQHPNIVSLKGVFFDEPPFYLEMDYVDGRDLKTWSVKRGGVERVPLEVRLGIVAQVADALHAAHEAGVIHRDIKPANILVSQLSTQNSQPTAKLTDFGVGQVVSAEVLAGVTRAGFTQTISGSGGAGLTGTQMYLAPELLAGQPASARSDIYALGVVLYQMLLGDLGRPLTTDWSKAIPEARFREILSRCFAGNPAERFADAGQLADALRSLPEGSSRREEALKSALRTPHSAIDQRLVTSAPTTAMRRWVAVAAVLALLAVALVVGVYRRGDEAGRKSATEPASTPIAAVTLPANVAGLSAGEILKIAYTGTPPSAPGQITKPQLQFEILAKRRQEPSFRPLGDGETLRSEVDDYLIVARPLTQGYLYVFQVDSTGKRDWLFPQNASSQFSSGSNSVAAGQAIQIPSAATGQALYLDRNTGIEHLYAVFSAVRWPDLEEALMKSPGQPVAATAQVARRVEAPIGLRWRGIGGVRTNLAALGQAPNVERIQDGKTYTLFVGHEALEATGSFMVIERWFRHAD